MVLCSSCKYECFLGYRHEAIERIQSESVESSNQYFIDALCSKVLLSMKTTVTSLDTDRMYVCVVAL